MRCVAASLLALCALPAWGATRIGTPVYWESGEPFNTPTTGTTAAALAAGSNRACVLSAVVENNTDFFGTANPASVALGGQTATVVIPTASFTALTNDIRIKHWIWNEAAITAMSGSSWTYVDDTTATNKSYKFECFEDVDQTLPTTHAGTANNTATTSLAVTTTSSAGDIVIVTAGATLATTTYSSFDTLTEDRDATGGSFQAGHAVGDGGDNSTTVTISATDGLGLASIVLTNVGSSAAAFSAGPTEGTNSTTQVTFDYTATDATTLYWASRNSGTSAFASCAALISEVGSPTSASINRGNPGVSTSVNVPFLYYELDVDFCLGGAGGNSALVTVPNVTRTCVGECIELIGSIGAGSPFGVPVDTTGDTTDGSPIITGLTSTVYFTDDAPINVSAGFAHTTLRLESKTETTITVNEAATSTQSNITTTGRVATTGTIVVSPTPEGGDWLEYDTTSDIGGDLSVDSSWVFDYTPDAGEESLMTALTACPQDVSDTTPEYSSPFNCWTGAGLEFLLNEPTPVLSFADAPTVIPTATTQNIDLGALCDHVRSITISLRTGDSLLAGLSLGSNIITGAVASETAVGSPMVVEMWCTSGPGRKAALQTWTMWVIDTVPMVDLSMESGLEAMGAAHDASRPWLPPGAGYVASEMCSSLVASGELISQNPAAGVEITANEAVSFVVSSGTCPPLQMMQRRRR